MREQIEILYVRLVLKPVETFMTHKQLKKSTKEPAQADAVPGEAKETADSLLMDSHEAQ